MDFRTLWPPRFRKEPGGFCFRCDACAMNGIAICAGRDGCRHLKLRDAPATHDQDPHPRRRRGPAQWPAGRAHVASRRAGYGHRVPPRRSARTRGHPDPGRIRRGYAHGLHHRRGRCQGAYGRAFDVGLRGPGAGQPLHRHHGRGGAHPRRLVGLLRVPAAERRRGAAERAQEVHPRHASRRGARGRGPAAQVGAAGALPRLQAALRDRLRPPCGGFHRPERRVRSRLGQLHARHRACPHLSASRRTWR